MSNRSYHFSLGNSSEGPVGFCARITASSKEAAVAKLQMALFDALDHPVCGEDADDIEYIQVYFNSDAITVDDIDEVDNE